MGTQTAGDICSTHAGARTASLAAAVIRFVTADCTTAAAVALSVLSCVWELLGPTCGTIIDVTSVTLRTPPVSDAVIKIDAGKLDAVDNSLDIYIIAGRCELP